MIRLVSPPRRGADATLPMINVAFLLLVFFLMAAVIAPPDAQPVDLPVTIADTQPDAGVRLTLMDDGSFAGLEGPADLTQLDGRAVHLRVDATTPGVDLANALARLSAAGVGDIRLLARQGRRVQQGE
jgi:biopolymer transport protein ExbD